MSNEVEVSSFVICEPVTVTKKYAVCPHCQANGHAVDHLINTDRQSAGPWYCDECGGGYSLKFNEGKMFIKKESSKRHKTLSLLRNGDIGLVVEGIAIGEEFDVSGKDYYYNSHTCPTNYLGKTLMLIHIPSNDFDPHGLFAHVKTVAFDPRLDDMDGSEDSEIFYDLFGQNIFTPEDDSIVSTQTTSPLLENNSSEGENRE